ARKQPGAGVGGSDVLGLLETVEAGDDLVQRLNEQFDQEVLAEAQARVQQRVEPHTWEAVRLTALEGLSGAEAAARLGLKAATVYKAKRKVQQMLHEEVSRLDQQGAPGGPRTGRGPEKRAREVSSLSSADGLTFRGSASRPRPIRSVPRHDTLPFVRGTGAVACRRAGRRRGGGR